MKIVMYAAIAALIAVPACAGAQQMYDNHHPMMQQHHPMPPPRMYRPAPEYRHRPIEYERRAYVRPRIERERIIHRGYETGGYATYGGGYGGEILEEGGAVYRHRESHFRHEHRAVAHRGISGCNCNCCCESHSASFAADPAEDSSPFEQSNTSNVDNVPADWHRVR